ncbi:MAG: hypothetical protein KatS3mg114_1024 [Planctomycetaceae bacterium]|nr:MAG: hypothetical protein KatS3mg114_1024 [Planctomycetaceae bacterium]
MPLPMKTVREAAAELGMSETELRLMIDAHKVRAVLRKGQLTIAPDEIARLRRLRKTQETGLRPGTPAPKPSSTGSRMGTAGTASPNRPAAGRVPPTANRSPTRTIKPPPLKVPPPPGASGNPPPG